MKPQEKLKNISTAYTRENKKPDGENIIVINKKNPLYEDIKDIQFKLNDETGTFELDYEIMETACDIIADHCRTIDELEYADLLELSVDSASVYTADRLGYMNINNQQNISDIQKEYGADDIATACAVWYEQQVARACEMLRDYILENEH